MKELTEKEEKNISGGAKAWRLRKGNNTSCSSPIKLAVGRSVTIHPEYNDSEAGWGRAFIKSSNCNATTRVSLKKGKTEITLKRLKKGNAVVTMYAKVDCGPTHTFRISVE